MHFTKSAIMGFLPAALAVNHQVIVGANNQLTFTPTTVNAAVGDTVQFMFATQVGLFSVFT
jgi:plastocyanin